MRYRSPQVKVVEVKTQGILCLSDPTAEAASIGLFIGEVSNKAYSKPEVSLSMNHALALVEVTFNITGYVEGAKMTALTLTSGSFAAAGTLHGPVRATAH